MIASEAQVNVAATAQEAYRRMLREYVAPALWEPGFRRGPSPGAFRLETATHACEVRFRKSRGSTTQDVLFWADLHTSDLKTEFVYWKWQLHSLAPEPLIGWTLEAGAPTGPVASEVLRIFHSYGWPAIQAALDNPGYPRDPSVQWARAFPKIPWGPATDDEIAAQRRSRRALEEAVRQADSDPRAFQAVLTRLETDPHPGTRHTAAWWLLSRMSDERARQALAAAAAEDEDVQVRWVARYAFRLAERGTSAGTAAPGISAAPSEPIVRGNWTGPGYGIPSAEGQAAAHLLATTESIFLDPVFAAKAMAALIAHCRTGQARGTQIFLVTGGAPTLFTGADGGAS